MPKKSKLKDLTTKPLPSDPPAPVVTAPLPTETTTGNPTRDALIRLLKGEVPANRAESFLLLRWGKLTRRQQYALAFEWDLPFPQVEDKQLAEAAIKELGQIAP